MARTHSSTLQKDLHRLHAKARSGKPDDKRRALGAALLLQVQSGGLAPEKALGLSPAEAPRFARFSAHLLEEGQNEEALAAAEVATALDPKLFDGWLVRACALARSQRVAEALLCYGQAAQVDAKNVRVWTDMAELHLGLLDFASAAECLKKAIDLDPHAETPAGKRAFILIAGSYYGDDQ